jgi:thiaminase/transcriptional activator TenA
MLAHGTPGEKLAAVGASEAIFVELCETIGPNLMQQYKLSAAEVEFFTFHDVLVDKIAPVEDALLARYSTTTLEKQAISRAIRLSHEFELMFYDTVLKES